MKTLLLVRHAKSDWNDPSLKDYDRPLNDRGKRDAPMMAQRLIDKRVKIDAFISSSAKRARKTAEIFSYAFNRKKEDIVLVDDLYLAQPSVFLDVINKVSDDHNCIAVFSHNPGITDFANTLSEVRVDDMPTCSIYAVRLRVKHWKDFTDSNNEFWFFDYPRAGE